MQGLLYRSTTMFTLAVAVTVAAMLASTAVAVDCKGEARGWGDAIAWSSYKEGLGTATAENKPVMLIIHKTWCGGFTTASSCPTQKHVTAEGDAVTSDRSVCTIAYCERRQDPESIDWTSLAMVVQCRCIPFQMELECGKVVNEMWHVVSAIQLIRSLQASAA